MSRDKQNWLDAQKRAARLVKYINRLSKIASNLPETAAHESVRAVLNRAEKRVYDLQRAMYRLKSDAAVDGK